MADFQYLPHEDGINNYLRKDGHSLSDSLNEIIDNARDQGATKVFVKTIQKDGRNFLVILNNGQPIADWKDFITLGGPSKRADGSIGHYGVGLKQFLSLFKSHTLFSKNGKTIEVRHKKDSKKGSQFMYSNLLPADSTELEIAKQAFGTTPKGVMVLVELEPQQLSEWEDIEVYEKSARMYFFLKDMDIYFNDEKIKKENPFGGLTAVTTEKFKGYPGISVKYYRVDSDHVTQERRGAYIMFNGRLVSEVGKYWFNHAEYNGHILIIEVDSWNNSLLMNNSINIVHQKNDFYLNKKSPLYISLQAFVKKIQDGVETSTKRTKKQKRKVENKDVLKAIPLPKGMKKTEDGNLVTRDTEKFVGLETSIKELERYLDGEIGTTLKKFYTHDHRFDSGRYLKSTKKLELVLKVFQKNVEDELRKVFYDLAVLEDFSKVYGIKTELYVCFPKLNTAEMRKIRERLESHGVNIL